MCCACINTHAYANGVFQSDHLNAKLLVLNLWLFYFVARILIGFQVILSAVRADLCVCASLVLFVPSGLSSLLHDSFPVPSLYSHMRFAESCLVSPM